ncbi:MAG: signal peptidase II [Clostridia bacterium]|nr:signal peptidase II [Clostridia bacterium]
MLIFFSLFMAAALVVIDQLTKALVVLQVKPVGSIPVIEGWLNWTYRENTGAAFSMFSDNRGVFLVSTVMLMGLCLYLMFAHYSRNTWVCFTFSLILGGGLGNMIDRVAAGYVVDFIHVSFFPAIFNFADCCVTVGACILFVLILVGMGKDPKSKKGKKTTGGEEEHGGTAQNAD